MKFQNPLDNLTEQQRKWIAQAIVTIAIVIAAILGVSYPIPEPPTTTVAVPDEIVALGVTHFSGMDVTGNETDELVVNQTDSGDIVEFRDDGTVVWRLADGGAIAHTGDYTVNGNLVVTGTSDLQDTVSDSGGDLTFGDNTVTTGTADIQNYVFDSTGEFNILGYTQVTGNSNNHQLLVTGYTTQTNSLLVLEASGGADQFTVSNAGATWVNGGLDLDGSTLTIDADGDSTLAENGDDQIELTLGDASGDFRVLTGNFLVGAGAPGLVPDGNDSYFLGTVEVDGVFQPDGGISRDVGAVTISDNLVVTDTADFQANVADSTGDFTIADDTVITGTTDFQGDISRSTGSLRVADDVLITGASDLRGNVSDGAGDLTITDDVLITDTLTVNQAAAADIADFKDSGVTTVKIPDGGGLLLNPAGSPSGSEGLLNYDNAKAGFHALEVYDSNGWRPIDPRRDLRSQTFIVISGTTAYPSEFSWIPVFTHPDLSTSMGGFWMAKYEMSQPGATRSNGYPAVAQDAAPGTVPAISQPGVPVWDYLNFDEARDAVKNAGTSYHLCTSEEWAAVAFWSQLAGTMPRGNNDNGKDIDVASDTCIDDPTHVGTLRCQTGTGPNSYFLNTWASGPADINGNVWEWTDGLFMDTSGYLYIFSDTVHIDEQQGTGTAATDTFTDTDQSWSANQWAGYYLQTSIGATQYITSNTGTVLTVDGTPTTGGYSIVRRIATDITSGMTSGHHILTLRDGDDDLKHLAIPATADATGSATYGNDGFWFDKSAFRAAGRGGRWVAGLGSGPFALYLYYAPSNVSPHFGFRACKAP